MVAQTAAEATGNAKATGSCSKGMCLWQTQEWCESPHVYPSAIEQWNNADKRHAGDRNPPAGAPVFYSGGSYGHAALSLGGGTIRSTDCQVTYDVSSVDLSWPEQHWGYHYKGWTEDIGDVQLPYLPPNGGGGDSGGILGMSDIEKTSTSKGQKLTDNGEWQILKIDDDGGLSLLTGPIKLYVATAGWEISGMTVGDVAQFRFVIQDDDTSSADKPTTTEYSYPITESIGTSGSTFGTMTWLNDIGGDKSTNVKRRLRVACKPPSGKSMTIADLTCRVAH